MSESRPRFLQPASILDYRELARRRLPRQLFDYIDGGAYDECSLRANVQDLQGVRLRQRVLRDVSEINLATTLAGQAMALPVVLGPVGLAGMFARRGEVQAARAARDAGIVFCESTVSICPMHEVHAAVGSAFWFQLYVLRDRGYATELLQRAQALGCEVLVFTVDLAVMGARYRDTRNGMSGNNDLRIRLARAWDFLSHPRWLADVGVRGKPLVFGNLHGAVPDAQGLAEFRQWVDAQFDPSVRWQDLDWLRANWSGKIIIKGVLDVEDARTAAAMGFDGLVVSNHGGRQLDGVPSTIAVLPEIAAAVGERMQILSDGGIRSGLDVVKAIALGADGCMLGRAWAYALAAGGEAAVAHMLEILRKEMLVAMALTGCTRLADLRGSAVIHAPQRRT